MKTTVTPNPATQNDSFVKFTLVLAIILFPFLSSAQNLITNSSFSNNTTGWSTDKTIELNPETVYGGSDAGNPVTEIDKERSINQNICIMAGVTYKLTFRATRRIDASTPNTASISIKIKGLNSNTTYISQTKSFNNNNWNWSAQSYSFSIPANSNDKKVNLSIEDYNNNTTFGVLLDDIELHPSTDMAITGATAAVLNSNYSYAVSNAPATGISYNWSMGTNASTASSASATPSTKWTSAGNKNMSVAISNGSCVVATLSAAVVVTGVLPVTVTNFTGVIKENKAALSWSTVNEHNNSHFVVERSANGRNYDSVGRIQAGSASANTYSFGENNANTISYYRLKQVDLDGAFVYSQVITLKNSGNSREMTVYPAQATSTLQYVVSNEAPATATVQVFTMAGQPVISQKEVLQAGLNVRSLTISQLAAGAYVLKLQVPATGVTSVKKFTKM